MLAALAILASGCAGRRESDVERLRSELSELRVAQQATSRDLASTTSQLQALDVKTLADEVARLNRRADAADAALADARVKLDMLATPSAIASAPPAASPVPAPLPPAPAVMAPVPAPLPPDPAVMTPAPSNRVAIAPPPAPLPPQAAMAPAPMLAAAPPATAVDKPRVPPSPTVAPARPVPKNPEQEYAAALATYRAREHGQAVIEFKDFIAKYPKHPLAGNAQYWIGEAYWAQRDYRQALVEFEKVSEYGPGKAPDALVKIGLCHARLREVTRAQQAWQRVIREYPRSEAAGLAQSLLRTNAATRQ